MGGGGGMAPNPLSKAHGFAMSDMQISKSEKKKSCPPPTKSWLRPWAYAESIGKRADFTGRPT